MLTYFHLAFKKNKVVYTLFLNGVFIFCVALSGLLRQLLWVLVLNCFYRFKIFVSVKCKLLTKKNSTQKPIMHFSLSIHNVGSQQK